jgi:hypothetical protein
MSTFVNLGHLEEMIPSLRGLSESKTEARRSKDEGS